MPGRLNTWWKFHECLFCKQPLLQKLYARFTTFQPMFYASQTYYISYHMPPIAQSSLNRVEMHAAQVDSSTVVSLVLNFMILVLIVSIQFVYLVFSLKFIGPL